ncbi:MAG: peptidase [Gammaproteobacteria bacterium]|nr:peptidase [Gammaproteobacteria bacterium]
MKILLPAILLSLLLAAAPGAARAAITLDQATRAVQQRTGGRVLAAERVRSADGMRFRIKVLLPGGRVRTIFVDPDRPAQRRR